MIAAEEFAPSSPMPGSPKTLSAPGSPQGRQRSPSGSPKLTPQPVTLYDDTFNQIKDSC